jgi:hypothetical protein
MPVTPEHMCQYSLIICSHTSLCKSACLLTVSQSPISTGWFPYKVLDACAIAIAQERHTCLHAACKAGHLEVVRHLWQQYGTLPGWEKSVSICLPSWSVHPSSLLQQRSSEWENGTHLQAYLQILMHMYANTLCADMIDL